MSRRGDPWPPVREDTVADDRCDARMLDELELRTRAREANVDQRCVALVRELDPDRRPRREGLGVVAARSDAADHLVGAEALSRLELEPRDRGSAQRIPHAVRSCRWRTAT